jgi:hypothetical protein
MMSYNHIYGYNILRSENKYYGQEKLTIIELSGMAVTLNVGYLALMISTAPLPV